MPNAGGHSARHALGHCFEPGHGEKLWQYDHALHADVLSHGFCGGLTPTVLNDTSGGVIWVFQHT